MDTTSVNKKLKDRFYSIEANLNQLTHRKWFKAVKDSMFEGLTVKPGMKLKFHLCEPGGLGDTSYLYAVTRNRNVEKDLTKVFVIKNDEIAIWELYLLINAETFLPAYWHANCVRRTYVFGYDDLKKIEHLQGIDQSLFCASDLQANCIIDNSGSDSFTADIYVCFWNDWQGLVKQHVRMSVKDKCISSFEAVSTIVLYQYNCGIMF